MASTAGKIKERRLERMRLGQAVCDFVTLPSDPEMRMAIVPLSEAEYRKALNKVYELKLNDDLAGLAVRDRRQSLEILLYSIREPDDLTQTVYSDVESLMDDLEVVDTDELIDRYNEMVEKSSPSLDAIPGEELDAVKKVLQTMDWNELSGRSWFALKRFLSTISDLQLRVNSVGSTSTPSLTTTSE